VSSTIQPTALPQTLSNNPDVAPAIREKEQASTSSTTTTTSTPVQASVSSTIPPTVLPQTFSSNSNSDVAMTPAIPEKEQASSSTPQQTSNIASDGYDKLPDLKNLKTLKVDKLKELASSLGLGLPKDCKKKDAIVAFIEQKREEHNKAKQAQPKPPSSSTEVVPSQLEDSTSAMREVTSALLHPPKKTNDGDTQMQDTNRLSFFLFFIFILS
jgi:hypothetical protein